MASHAQTLARLSLDLGARPPPPPSAARRRRAVALCARATASADASAPPAAPSFERDFRSLAAACAPAAAVVAARTPLGRGLVAARAVAPGEPLLEVDEAFLLCVADEPAAGGAHARRVLADFQALHGPLPPPLLAALGDASLDWGARLAALVLHLRARGAGPWRHYARLIPAPADFSVLSHFEPAEQAALQVPALAALARREREQLAALHASLFAPSGRLGALGLAPAGVEDTRWALAAVNSRCFSETSPAGERLSLAVPAADMANHSARPNAAFAYDAAVGVFRLTAITALAPGEEALITYGCEGKSSAALMRDYGFVTPANFNDRLPFSAGDDAASRAEAAARGGSGSDAAAAPRLHAGALMRAWGLEGAAGGAVGAFELAGDSAPAALARDDSDERQRQRRRAATLLSLAPFLYGLPAGGGTAVEPPLSESGLAAERAAAAALRAQARSMLAALPTTTAEDEAALRAGGLGARAAAAVAARLEHKRLAAAAEEGLGRYFDSL
jgi:hypothetical protein